MASNLRQLLIQRAARLQERPALSAPEWGTLSYGQFRNRVEGIALGLLSTPQAAGFAVFVPGEGPWVWAAEVAAACCGLAWDASGATLDPEALGGALFNSEEGRGPYHDREDAVEAALPFHAGLDQGEVLRRLVRLNQRLGWDHETEFTIPVADSESPASRAALWSALYAGAHAHLAGEAPGRAGWFRAKRSPTMLDLTPFRDFWL